MYPNDNKNTEKNKVIDIKAAEKFIPKAPKPLEIEEETELSYPVEALGLILGEAAKALHEDVKAPLAMCGQSLLAAAALAGQAYYNVRTPVGSEFPISLYALTSGGSGDRKSTIDKVALKPIRDHEQRLVESYKEEKAQHKLELEAYEQTKRSILADKRKGKDKLSQAELCAALIDGCTEPQAPLTPYLVSEDPTIEGLFRSLSEGQASQGIFTDEGAMFIGGHAMNGENKIKTAGRLSKAWEGSPFDRTRGGEEISKLHNRRVSMHVMVQPSILKEWFKQTELESQGFLPRFLLACPHSLAGVRFMGKVTIAQEERAKENPAVTAYFKVMDTLADTSSWPVQESDAQELEPSVLTFTQQASDLFIDTYNLYERQLGRLGSYDHLRPFVSRFMEQASRIAGVLLCIEQGTNEKTLDSDHLKRGIALAQYSLDSWDDSKRTTEEAEPLRVAQLLLDWLHKEECEFVYSMKVSQLAPNSLRKKPARDKAIKELVEHGHLYPVEGGKILDGKQRKLVWKIIR